MDIIKNNTKCYWEKLKEQNYIIVTKRTIVHPWLYVMVVTAVKYIPKSLWNINQACKDLQRNPICLTGYDHDFTLDEIKHGEKLNLR